jgi:N-acetylglucosamine-6-phosphate deacetylase
MTGSRLDFKADPQSASPLYLQLARWLAQAMAEGRFQLPGFIDLHVHGGGG